MANQEPTKCCTRCHVLKPFSEFPSDRKTKTGRYAYCFPCKKAYETERRRKLGIKRHRSIAEIAESMGMTVDEYRAHWRRNYERRRRRSDPEFAAKCREAVRRWSQSTKGKANRLAYDRREDVKAKKKRYHTSTRGRQLRQEAVRRWQRTSKGQETQRAYESLPKVRATRARYRRSDRGRNILRQTKHLWQRRLRSGQIKPNGVKQRPDVDSRDLVSAYNLGQSTYEIGQRFGMSPSGVAYRLRAAGVTLRDRRWGASCTCADGHVVSSSLERIVDEWLYRHDLPHEYEPTCPWPNTGGAPHRADFLVGDTYIEVWGMAGEPTYDAKRTNKLAFYTQYGLKLIQLFPSDFSNNQVLSKLGQLIGR